MRKKAAVIGAGIGGLSAAIALRARGFDVDVYEKNIYTGGKAGREVSGGFVFDTGPSLLTLPSVFGDLLGMAGGSLEGNLPVTRLDIICKYFFADGTELTAYGDRERLIGEFCEKTIDERKTFEKFFSHCEKIYDNASGLFLFNSLEKVPGIFREDPLKALRTMASLDIFRTLHASHRAFFRDPNTIQLFDRYATYSGSDPFRIPATLNIIPHVEYGIGAYVPRGGIRAIPEALTGAASQAGVRFFAGTAVDRVFSEAGRIKGLSAGGGRRDYDIVVSNSDVTATYRDLLGDSVSGAARRYLRLEPSSSAIVYYWGVSGAFRELDVNNIFFSKDYKKEFRQIFGTGICPEDPTVYINISSKYLPTDAPPGCENWFVLVNVPYDTGQDWEQEARVMRERVISILEKRLGVNVRDRIISESVMTPADILERTYSNRGSIYGISSNSRMAAYNRQPNRSKEHRGLYFAGGSAHPGGGMPLVALSGMIAAELAEKYSG